MLEHLRYHVEVFTWHRELPGELHDLFHTDTYSIISSRLHSRYLTIIGIDVPVEFGPPDLNVIDQLKKSGAILDIAWTMPTVVRKEQYPFPVYNPETLKIEMKHIVNEYIQVHTSEQHFEQFIDTSNS
jgi:hypothetical protein